MARRSAGPWFRAGTGSWYATVGGKSVPLGVRGEDNRDAATAAWHKLMSGGPPGAVAPPLPAVTVGELLGLFLADLRDRAAAANTVKVYGYFYTRFKDAFGNSPAAAIRPHVVEAVTRRPKWSSSTRYTAIGAIVAAFRWGERVGLLAANPLRGMKKPPKTSRGAKTVITAEHHTKLCEVAHPAFRALLCGLWLTGCRPGELAALTAADVNLDAGVALLQRHKTVNVTGQPRAVYLSAEAVELFRAQIAAHPTGPLFPRPKGGAWGVHDVETTMRRVRKRAGVPTATAYGYRHGFATEALSRGVPDAQVAALLGHQGTAMLHKHYAHLCSRAALLREAAGRVRGDASTGA